MGRSGERPWQKTIQRERCVEREIAERERSEKRGEGVQK